MHQDTHRFLNAEVTEERLRDRNCLEVGSLGNFTVHDICDKFRCKYTGLDMQAGLNVDVVLKIEDMTFIEEFDIVISCNTLEHVEYWREALFKMKQALKPGGIIFISVPSDSGRHIDTYHGYPSDYWRFSGKHLLGAFSEYELLHYSHTDEAISTENIAARKVTTDNPLSCLDDIELTKVPIPKKRQ